MRFLLAFVLAAFVAGSATGFGAAQLATAQRASPAIGVVRYMDALRHQDGRQIWASYSAAFQERHILEGDSEAATIALYEKFREDGASIDETIYVGGYQARESGYFLYVTRHFRPHDQPIEVVWIFQTDSAGLIDRVVI
jgi:hypothetical protein